MTTKTQVDGFFADRKFAVVGASRSGGKMGNMVLKEIGPKGFTLYAIHPEADEIDGVKTYRSYADLPEPVSAAYIAVAPGKCMAAVQEAHGAGVKRVFIQQGAQSDDAVAFCEQNGVDAITKECIFMYAEPVGSIHKFHRFFKKLFGGMPK